MRLAKFVATGWTALALVAGVVPGAAQADDPWSRVDVEIVVAAVALDLLFDARWNAEERDLRID